MGAGRLIRFVLNRYGGRSARVGKWPVTDKFVVLFDQLVGAREHRLRHIEAERLGGLEVEHRLVPGRRLHRQVGRLLPLEDAVEPAARRYWST